MKLRLVLLLAMGGLVTAILAGVVAGVVALLTDATRDELSADLARAKWAFEDLQESRRARFRSEAVVVAEEPRLKAVVAAEDVDPETVLGVARDMQEVLQADIFVLTDAAGIIRANVDDPEAAGQSLRNSDPVRAALRRGEGSDVWIDGEQAYQVHATAVRFGETTVGVVVVGYRLDAQVTDAFERQTGCAAVVALDHQPLVMSGIPAEQQRGLPEVLERIPDGTDRPVEVSIGGVRYLAVADGFPQYEGHRGLRYVVLSSLDRALEPEQRLLRLIYGIALAAFVVALLLAVFLSRRLTRPVETLASVTRDVAAGRLEVKAEESGPTELRDLGAAMNRMVAELARARDVELDHARLEKEMEIAAIIQTSLVPKHIVVPGLEVAADMKVATEVGGDYYDVMPCKDGAWIGVGDVAGHGLSAGLVMLMVQCVASAVTRNQQTDSPAELLGLLNLVLFDNVRNRLGQDEFVTLTLIRYYKEGHMIFAGAHEDILICPKQGGRCSRVRTPGPWIGAAADVSRTLIDTGHRLDPGDIVVLYTDGITEAMNDEREQFGIERLCDVIERNRAESVDTIRDRIFEAVEGFMAEQDDDMSVVVMRFVG